MTVYYKPSQNNVNCKDAKIEIQLVIIICLQNKYMTTCTQIDFFFTNNYKIVDARAIEGTTAHGLSITSLPNPLPQKQTYSNSGARSHKTFWTTAKTTEILIITIIISEIEG